METSVQVKMILDSENGTYSSNVHPQNLITRLNSLRLGSLMTDIQIKVNDELFPCHKVVLVALSPYFQGMFSEGNFSESSVNTVELKEVSSAAVISLIKFMYTGSLKISEDIVSDLLFAANMWQLKDVVESCRMYLGRKLTTENAASTLHLSIIYNFNELMLLSRKLLCENLDVAFRNQEFVNLSYKEIMGIIVNPNLTAPKEVTLSAVVKWIESNEDTDEMDMITLLSLIPLNLVNLDSLMEKYSSEIWQRFCLSRRYFKNVIDSVQSVAGEELVAVQNVEQILGDEIFILDSISRSRSIIKFNKESGHSDRLADVPHPHNCNGPAVVNNKVFAIDARSTCALSKYDPQLNTWTSCRQVPTRVIYSSVGVLNKTIYVCGGIDPTVDFAVNSVEKYNPETDEWSSVASLQYERFFAHAAALNGHLYVIGGRHDTSCERYSPLSNTWESVSPLPSPRDSAAAVVVNNCIYIIGGFYGRHEVSSVLKYDVVTDIWCSCAEMPYSAYNLSACKLGNKIFVSGGDGINGQFNRTAVFDINLNSWTEGPDLPRPMSCHASFPVTE